MELRQPTLRPDVMRNIDRFHPHNVHPDIWTEVAPLVREAVARTVPANPQSAQEVMGRAARVAEWCYRRGLPVTAEVVFHPDTIDEFVTTQLSHLTAGTQLNYRYQLRRIGEVLLGSPLYGSRPTPMRKSDPVRPYSRDEVSALIAASRTYPTERQREGVACLLALSLGAGLGQQEVAHISGPSVEVTADGVFINIEAGRRRRVPVRIAWEQHVVDLAAAAGNDFLFMPRCKRMKKLAARFVERLPRNDSPKLSVQRLRATWLVDLLDRRVPYNVITEAAGVGPDQVAVYVRYMSEADPAEAARLLRQ